MSRNAWIQVFEDVVYSRHPARGSVRVGADLNGDGDLADAGERSRRVHTDTLKRETQAGGPIPRGNSIPSVLRIGPYHDRDVFCPEGCSLDVADVWVSPRPPAPDPDPNPDPDPDPGPCDGVGFKQFSSSHLPGPCWRPYSDSSPWNAPIPDATPTQANSARLVDNLLGPRTGVAKFGDPDLETSNLPIYWSDATGADADPLVRIHCTHYGGDCPVEGKLIPLHPDAVPAGGYDPGPYDDATMIVQNTGDGREYDFWHVQSRTPGNPGTLKVGWGGYAPIDGRGDADSNLGAGSSASGSDLPQYGGTITGEELAARLIPHALRLNVPCSGSHVYPAGKGAGSCGAKGSSVAVPMGTRFQLTISEAQIDRLDLPGWQKAILRAFHTYGGYAADGGGGGPNWALEWSGCDMYESAGRECRFVQYAKQQGIAPQDFDHDGNLEYQFKWWRGIDWAAKLRVVPPPPH